VMMSLGRKAAIGAGWLIAWRGISRLLGVANTIILARLLVPADFGLVAMAMMFETSLLMITSFPVQDALLRRPEADTHLHDVAFTIQVTRAFLMSLIIATAAPLAADWFSEPRLTLLLVALAATTVINGFFNIGIVEFQRELRFDVQVKIQLVPAVLQVFATVGVAWLTRSYWALIVGLAVMRVSRAVMTYAVHPYRPRLSLTGWRQLAGFSFWLWLASLAAMVWGQVDTFVVGPAFGSAGLGLYVLAGQVASLPSTELVEPVAAVLLAGFAYAQRERTVTAANPLIIASALVLLMAPMALVISAGAANLVTILLGTKWSAAAPLVAIAAGQCLFQPFIQVAGAALIARGNVRGQFFVTAVAAGLRAMCVTLAAMTGSLTMVIVATLAALGTSTLLYTLTLRSDFKDGLGRFLGGLARITLATAIAGLTLVVLGVGWKLPESEPLRHFAAFVDLGVLTTIVVVTYTATLLLLWVVFGRPNGPERVILNLLQEFLPGRWLRDVAARVTVRLSS
ncbi:MAG: oligosaccharide flippase family protein, partial [Pirellulales bacterium]